MSSVGSFHDSTNAVLLSGAKSEFNRCLDVNANNTRTPRRSLHRGCVPGNMGWRVFCEHWGVDCLSCCVIVASPKSNV